MTKEEVIQLGIASQQKRDVFQMHCEMNQRIDPTERAAQIAAFEKARADWWEAMNKHHDALRKLGLLPELSS